ncbi:MAG: acetyl-CoA carboxylase biotin carboxyl carrier protein subunit [Treponema sp.]|jgi:acetyl-CoA carboxylase biotin carboxyl carrier protein|nr:acetyl-CoA carboxylase biotin carboxyl carrier protein subunit [Treponema sp.]
MNDTLLLTILDKFSTGDIVELVYDDGKTHLVLRKKAGDSTAPLYSKAPESSVHEKPASIIPPKQESNAPKSEMVLEGISLNQAEIDAVLTHSPNHTATENEPITSPLVAVFYAAPAPDAPPFVTPGTKVKAGATLCILEAMKTMNKLEAEFDCEIVSVKVATGVLVEYGQPLFEVKRLT